MKLTSNRQNFLENFPYPETFRKKFFDDLIHEIATVDNGDAGELYVHCVVILSSNEEHEFVSSSADNRLGFQTWLSKFKNVIAYILDIQQGNRRLSLVFNQKYEIIEINIDTPTFEDEFYKRKYATLVIPCISGIYVSPKHGLYWVAEYGTLSLDFDNTNAYIQEFLKKVVSDDEMKIVPLYRVHLLNAYLKVNFLKSSFVTVGSEYTLRFNEALDLLSDLVTLPNRINNLPEDVNLNWLNDEIERFAEQHFKIYERGLIKLSDKGLL